MSNLKLFAVVVASVLATLFAVSVFAAKPLPASLPRTPVMAPEWKYGIKSIKHGDSFYTEMDDELERSGSVGYELVAVTSNDQRTMLYFKMPVYKSGPAPALSERGPGTP